MEELRDLADPKATSRWLSPNPAGPIIGIEQTVHFFFDDHTFNQMKLAGLYSMTPKSTRCWPL